MSSKGVRYLPLVLLLGLAFFPLRVLEVRAQKSGQILLLKTSPIGLLLEVRYIHSVEGVPVIGRFQIAKDGRIQPKETLFPSFGAGLPNEFARQSPQGWFLKQEGQTPPLEELSILVSPETKQVLKVGGMELRLDRLAHGETVRVMVQRHFLAEVIWRHARPSERSRQGGPGALQRDSRGS